MLRTGVTELCRSRTGRAATTTVCGWAGLCYIKGMTLARLRYHPVCNDFPFGRLFSPYVVAGDTLTVALGVRMRAYVGPEADRNSDDGRVLPEGLRALGLCQAKRLVATRVIGTFRTSSHLRKEWNPSLRTKGPLDFSAGYLSSDSSHGRCHLRVSKDVVLPGRTIVAQCGVRQASRTRCILRRQRPPRAPSTEARRAPALSAPSRDPARPGAGAVTLGVH
jgi:hypothetical protein